MTTRDRLQDDEYREEVEDVLTEIGDKTMSELVQLKRTDDQIKSDAAKLELNSRFGDAAGNTQTTGVKLNGQIKRGTGTRDQDEIKFEARGKDAQDAAEKFEETLSEIEDGGWTERLRNLQADE